MLDLTKLRNVSVGAVIINPSIGHFVLKNQRETVGQGELVDGGPERGITVRIDESTLALTTCADTAGWSASIRTTDSRSFSVRHSLDRFGSLKGLWVADDRDYQLACGSIERHFFPRSIFHWHSSSLKMRLAVDGFRRNISFGNAIVLEDKPLSDEAEAEIAFLIFVAVRIKQLAMFYKSQQSPKACETYATT